MRIILRNVLFLGFTLSLSFAQAQIADLASYQGPACPQGSVSATTSPEGGAISILFDQFTAETSPENLYQWKWCSLNINVDIPDGFRIAKVQADQRAFADIPEQSYGYFWSYLYVLDSSSHALMNSSQFSQMRAPVQDNIVLTHEGTAKAPRNCQERREQIRLDTGVFIGTSPQAELFAMTVVDSVDLSLKNRTGSQVKLQLERCPRPPAPPRWPYSSQHNWL